jgi:hypothetical protein
VDGDESDEEQDGVSQPTAASNQGDLAVKVFELSKALMAKWLAAHAADIAKKQLLGIVCLNLRLADGYFNPRNEKALRHSRRRATRPIESGRQDAVRTFSGRRAGLGEGVDCADRWRNSHFIMILRTVLTIFGQS